jgi:hypothetical protein
MTSAYTAFDAAKPAGSQTGPNFAASATANDVALWYCVVMGGNAPGFVASKSGGTTEEPGYYTFTNGAQIVRATNTWTSGNLTQQVWEVSQDTGGTYASVCTQTFTYDGTTGALTATTGAGGMSSFFGYVVGKLKALKTAYDAHAAATGSSVHGLGTIATQAASAVNITGGTASVTIEREAKTALGNVSGSTSINWNSGGLFTATVTGSSGAFTHSNLPNGVVGYVTLEVTNGGLASSLLTAQKPGGAALSWTSSGKDIVTLMCHDGSTVEVVGFSKDVK